MSRDHRIFMTGAIVALLVNALLSVVEIPWWLRVPLTLAGFWVGFRVTQEWVREIRRNKPVEPYWRED